MYLIAALAPVEQLWAPWIPFRRIATSFRSASQIHENSFSPFPANTSNPRSLQAVISTANRPCTHHFRAREHSNSYPIINAAAKGIFTRLCNSIRARSIRSWPVSRRVAQKSQKQRKFWVVYRQYRGVRYNRWANCMMMPGIVVAGRFGSRQNRVAFPCQHSQETCCNKHMRRVSEIRVPGAHKGEIS